MSNVTATATGGSSENWAVNNESSSSPTMNNVTATASGGNESYGVRNSSSSPTMDNVTATASGGTTNYGVRNIVSSATMNNVTATASGGINSYGVENNESSATIRGSSITGTTTSIRLTNVASAMVANTMLDGSVSGTTFTCVGAHTAAFAALNATCT